MSEVAGASSREVWNFGRIFNRLGAVVPADRPALIHGDQITRWGDFDRRSTALAAAFVAGGAVPGDKVALLMRNSPAYLETTVAGFKARLVHVNINFRYTGEELFYILDNSDAAVLVHDAEFANIIAQLAPRLPKLKNILQVGGQPHDNARDYALAANAAAALPPQDYSADDLFFIYTGGTTGMPKGVMWDHAALWAVMSGGAPMAGMPALADLDALTANTQAGIGVNRVMVLPPLMHGTGLLTGLSAIAKGGTVVTVPGLGFDPADVFAVCAKHAPDYAIIVGDAFARPLLRALDAGLGSIASLKFMVSSGTMWSPEVKAGLLRHNPEMIILDSLGSSESVGLGVAAQTAANAGEATRFVHDDNTQVLGEDMRPVVPGSGAMGRIARCGPIPRGYYKDEAKSAATFVTVDGVRYAMPGDFATVEADGAIVLLGRGSQCINSGGEKIFPEEVEEALKTHPAVDDALVFGVADEKWGQRVTAVVESAGVDTALLLAHVRSQLAAYKTPKAIIVVPKVPRAPNGKADYASARAMAGG